MALKRQGWVGLLKESLAGAIVPSSGTQPPTRLRRDGACDAPKPGGPLTTRQPAEFYESHVMKPIHVQKWLLEPTHHTHKMYIFIQK